MKKLFKENLKINTVSQILSDEGGKRKYLKERLGDDENSNLISAVLMIALEENDNEATGAIVAQETADELIESLKDKYGDDAKKLLDKI